MHESLRPWRKFRKMTLEGVAAALETNYSVISRLERGEARLNTDWIKRLARVYECTTEELLRPPEFVTPIEEEILEAARDLDIDQQKALLALAKSMGRRTAAS